MIGVAVLGSTGSIGCSTLDVIARHPTRYRVVALSAHRNLERIYQQCHAFRPEMAVMADQECAAELRKRLERDGLPVQVEGGAEALERAAAHPRADQVMAAIVGAEGVASAFAALRHGKRLLLANKEALVVAGSLLLDAARRHGAAILPIDSEHNAVFQCLPSTMKGNGEGVEGGGVRRILLTASGGPFRNLSLAELPKVSPQQACAHPNWSMGRKISVDSATMMNKGLEVIEACHLFAAAPSQVEVVIHPQSIVHSLVEYVDGSTLAQMGNPDMRTPIAHALAWPERIESGAEFLDLLTMPRLEFEAPDLDRFPCLGLAYAAAEAGGTAPAILNAANEVAVAAFLDGQISFTTIHQLNDAVLQQLPSEPLGDLEQVLAADARARELACRLLDRFEAPLHA